MARKTYDPTKDPNHPEGPLDPSSKKSIKAHGLRHTSDGLSLTEESKEELIEAGRQFMKKLRAAVAAAKEHIQTHSEEK
jgi:hypothetical protein